MIRWLAVIGPGLLVAATGVGAGDLATATIVGSQLGTAVLWAALVGAFFKYVVTEGLARYQLATGDTLIEGVINRFGPIVGWLFLPYFLFWSFLVASALMNASGVTLHALIPIFDDATTGKIAFGVVASLAGLALALGGGYALFEKVMSVCIGIMFVTVLVTAALVWPGTGEVLSGLVVPRIPELADIGLSRTVALIGGIGGTFTVLCYGYWIREEGRNSTNDIGLCRIDLGTGYLMTALFGVAMIIIGSTIEIEGSGASLLVTLSERLTDPLGRIGSLLFLIGAAGAVFSSLLGVWQAVPYLFADVWQLLGHKAEDGERPVIDTRALPYRGFLVALAILPMPGLFLGFQSVQIAYALVGASFIPLLTLALLLMNGRGDRVGEPYRNRPLTIAVLLSILAFFIWVMARTLLG